tara:strand:+ start:199 stop:666 length:468 start_codon:yes stop_codon:yes gene_type:complete
MIPISQLYILMLSISHYRIIAIGKVRKQWIKEGIEMYLKRLPGLQVIEVKDSTQSKEEYAIKELMKKDETLVTLNENGQSFTSKEFSEKLIYSQHQNITFTIGGSTGFSSSLNDSAAWQLSLSPLTFPHEIARLLLIEQLYRAKTIAQGGPYHKE